MNDPGPRADPDTKLPFKLGFLFDPWLTEVDPHKISQILGARLNVDQPAVLIAIAADQPLLLSYIALAGAAARSQRFAVVL